MKKVLKNKKTLSNYRVYKCGYCDLQYIFKHIEPVYYHASAYGWDYDVYIDAVHGLAFTTGYRGMFGNRIPYELIDKYEDIAREILKSRKTWEEVKKELETNKENFINELLNN